MNIKPVLNHKQNIQTLLKMTSEQRLLKAFELSEITKRLFLEGLKIRFPEKNDEEIKEIYLQRLLLCYNRNY
ncbi:MAG: hypothetical protein HY958_10120 [Bacteroidia bacterium]|nr:hypothetical protein [Bacteroidia bacterium]